MNSARPKQTIQIVGETPSNSSSDHTILLVAPMLASGTATAGEVITNLTNASEVYALVGRKSLAGTMYTRVRKHNKFSRVDILPLAELTSGATKATAAVAFSGTTTAAGQLKLTVVSASQCSITVDLAPGATASDTAASIASSVNALVADLPFAATSSTGTVTFTSTQNGTEFNGAYISVEGAVAGLTYTVTGWANGTGDPSITDDLINAIPKDIRYGSVVLPRSVTRTKFITEWRSRFNTDNLLVDGLVFQGIQGADESALTSSVNALNNPVECLIVSKQVDFATRKGTGIRELLTFAVCDFVAVRGLRLTTDAPLTQYVPVNGTNLADAFGGPALATLSYANTVHTLLAPIPAGHSFLKDEVDRLERGGYIVIQNNRVGTQVTTAEGVTTYKFDNIGNADTSFKFINNIDASTEFRKLLVTRFYEQFGVARIGGSTIRPNRAMVNEALFAAFLDAVYLEASDEPFILTQAGEDRLNFFRANRTVTIDRSLGKISFLAKVPYVSQVRELIGVIGMEFDI